MTELQDPATGIAKREQLKALEKQQRAVLRPLANRRPELYEEDEYTSDEYEQMLEMYQGTLASIDEGEIVKSTVLEIRDNVVVLDIGFKSEGTVPLEEFKDLPDLKAGDIVEVLLEHLEDQEGSVVLSKKKADFMRVWERIRLAYESDEPVEGTLVKKIKGGVVVDLMGVDAFLPGSQIALRRVPNIDELLGQKYEFKIIKLNKRRRNIVVSRRVILENERAGKRDKLMKELQKDQVRKGVVKNITDFGAFIDLGGVDGLLHITDMSWGRVSHPTEMVQIGQELEVKAQSKTLGGQISAIAAYQQYVLARAATSIGDEFYDQATSLLKAMQDGKLKITQEALNTLMTRVSLPTMYYDAARVFLDYAKDTQNLIADEGSARGDVEGDDRPLEGRQPSLERLGGVQVEVVGRLVEQQQGCSGELEQQDLEARLLAARE